MKKLFLIFTVFLFANIAIAQTVSKTVNLTTAGTLTSLLTAQEKATITNLSVTGFIDARDIKCMRDELVLLATLDLSGSNIVAYNGNDGTSIDISTYLANEMPNSSFNKSISGEFTANSTLISVILPNSINSIATLAFSKCIKITNISIPNTVTTIGSHAFEYCWALTQVQIPNSVISIGSYAFSNCHLAQIEIPNSVTSIESGTFYNCRSLTQIQIPNSVSSIGSYAFIGCTSLVSFSVQEVNPNYSTIDGVLFNKDQSVLVRYPTGKQGTYSIPNSVTTLDNSCFSHCPYITNITIPSSVSLLNKTCDRFSGCSSLAGFLVQPDNPNYSSIDGVLFDKNQKTLISYPDAKIGLYVIPASVTRLEDCAFSAYTDCLGLNRLVINIPPNGLQSHYGLIELTIGNSFTSIDDWMFSGCKSLSVLTIGSSVTNIGEYAFHSVDATSNFKRIHSLNPIPPVIGTTTFGGSPIVYVPYNSIDAYRNAPVWRNFYLIGERHVTINNTTAGGLAAAIINAGYGPLNTITHLTVTGNLNSIDIFQINTKMNSLLELDISAANLTNNSLPDKAFLNNTELLVVKLPNTLVSIGKSAFSGCTSLYGNVPIPATVTTIGSSAFNGCKGLDETLNLPDNLIAINDSAFNDCVGIKGNISIPNLTTVIGKYSFYNCSGLKGNLTMPNLISSIGEYAFGNCTGFSGNMILSNSLSSIGNYAFLNCSGIIGDLTIPNFVISVGDYAFNNSGINGITIIPCSLTTIGSNAFMCPISEFVVSDTNPNYSNFDKGLFNKNKTLLIKSPNGKQTFTIPSSVTSIERYAFINSNNIYKLSINKMTPINLNYDVFNGLNKVSCVLEVPVGSSYAYQTAKYWDAFIFVTEKDFNLTTNTVNTINSRTKVFSTKSRIIIEGTSKGEIIMLYTLTGFKLMNIISSGESISIPANKGFAYLVKVSDNTFKVIL